MMLVNEVDSNVVSIKAGEIFPITMSVKLIILY